ncbi:hypothetical protein [Chitinophaga sp. S165]|uniref:hypothetical protein n=1 Tax=Chitinophaga sp. S165 TaxID=2135462 RepID=UPI000D719B91|nr:hypothetical protein [Chitinophaga sp. S165]PWV45937.1 hypothetical protein C7475_112155 [Chitinophaga sp. S165]
MAKAKRNRYQKAATKQATLAKLSSRLETKGDVKHSAMETGKDLLIGVLGGGLVAALIGKPAFLVGLGVTGIGHFAGNTLASTFGLGMMAGGNIVGGSVSGMDGLEGAKERMQAFKDSMLQRTYLDKFIKKETVNGTVGALQYFDYGQVSGTSDNPELYGMGALDEIEQSLADVGMARLQGAEEVGTIGALSELELQGPTVGSAELDGAIGFADVSDYNF